MELPPPPQPQPGLVPAPPSAQSSAEAELGQAGPPLTLLIAQQGDWQRAFPRLIRPSQEAADPTAVCASAQGRHFDLAWFASCFAGMPAQVVGTDGNGARLHFPAFDPALFQAGVNRANLELFQNGYVNSGFLVDVDPASGVPARVNVVQGSLGSAGAGGAFEPCGLSPNAVADGHSRAYIRRRLMQGCRPDRPFNAYQLERDFRRLADDREQWIEHLSLKLEPLPQGGGMPAPGPHANYATLGWAMSRAERLLPPDRQPRDGIASRPHLDLVIGAANDRSPSVGSARAFVAATLRGPYGFLLDGEAGITEGGLDASASALIAFAPRWSLRASGDYSEAEVVDPILRPLDIRSRGWGAEGALVYGAISCPLTPLFGHPVRRQARVAAAPDGEGCALGARLAGDVPLGYANARDVEVSLILSHRSSQSFLLGVPFSFAPGSVDGRSDVTTARAQVDWLERGRSGETSARGWTFAARLRVSVGLDGSRTDLAGVAAPPRHFVVIGGQAGYSTQLPWRDTVLTLRVSGQYTGDLLYTAERLPVGGVNSVRGYPEAALLVDRGVAASVELNRTVSLFGARDADFAPGRFRLSVFADGAIADNLNPATRRTDTLGSVGAGLAWVPTQNGSVEVRASYARRLGPDLSGGSDALSSSGVHVGVVFRPLLLFRRQNRPAS